MPKSFETVGEVMNEIKSIKKACAAIDKGYENQGDNPTISLADHVADDIYNLLTNYTVVLRSLGLKEYSGVSYEHVN